MRRPALGQSPPSAIGAGHCTLRLLIVLGRNNVTVRFDLRHIRDFVVVAEERHFHAAAERLHITQPALSRTIRWLEDAVGTPLLTRTTRRVQLTEAGRVFLHECNLALCHIDRALEAARSAAQGRLGYLRIAYMDFAMNSLMPGIIDRFRREYPSIKLDMVYMPSSEQEAAILESTVDIGFLIGPFVAKGVSHILLNKEKMVVLLPTQHPLTKKKSIALKDLATERFVLGSATSWAKFRTHFFSIFHHAGISPIIAQEASSSDGIFGLVAANIGIAIYSECVRNIRREGLVIRPLSDKIPPLETIVCWRSDDSTPTKQTFVEFLSKNHAA